MEPASAPTHSPVAEALLQKAHRLLMAGEQVRAIAAQNALGRSLVMPASGVILTDWRVLFVYRGLASLNFRDFHWEHINDVHLATSLTGAKLTVTAAASKDAAAAQAAAAPQHVLSMDNLDKEEAHRLYSIAQQLEVEWRERTRQRIMEERRTGHLVAAPPSLVAGPTASPPQRATRQCPACAEEILVDAKKCKHCGEWLSAAQS